MSLHCPRFYHWSQGPRIAEGQFHTAVTESKKAWSISDFLCSLLLVPIQQQACIYSSLPFLCLTCTCRSPSYCPSHPLPDSSPGGLYSAPENVFSIKLRICQFQQTFSSKRSMRQVGCQYICNYIMTAFPGPKTCQCNVASSIPSRSPNLQKKRLPYDVNSVFQGICWDNTKNMPGNCS